MQAVKAADVPIISDTRNISLSDIGNPKIFMFRYLPIMPDESRKLYMLIYLNIFNEETGSITMFNVMLNPKKTNIPM